MADLVESPASAARLADHLLDPGRTRPVVCVTVPTWASQPLLDVAALERKLPDSAVEVCVMPTGDATWELTRRLPTGFDVYGGAVRLWWPGLHEPGDRRDHPLFLVHSASETPAVVERLLAALERGGVLQRADGPPAGSEHGAVVRRVLPEGAELTLVDGTQAYAHRSHLSRHDLAADRVVRVGQPVRVRVGHRVPGGRRVMVSLRPFEPDPWARLTEAYPVGTAIEAVVAKLRNIGALVEVLPGLTGLLHKSRLSVVGSHPEEVLAVGQRITVRIERYEAVEGESRRRIDLSLLDTDGRLGAPAASLLPDGPPWLAPVVEPDPPPPVRVRNEPWPGRSMLPSPRRADSASSPAAPTTTDRGQAGDGEPAKPADRRPTEPTGDRAREEPGSSQGEPTEVERLAATTAQAVEARLNLHGLLDDSERRLNQLRGEAALIRRQLEQELGEVRRRIMEVVESESAQLLGSTQAALDEARAEAGELREQLAAVEADRHRLLDRIRELAGRTEQAEHAAAEARQELRRERAAGRELQARLRRLDPDEHASLRDEIRQAWQRMTTLADRERYPWREPIFGPDFVPSLHHVHGVAYKRLAEVCAEVLCGRAPQRPGLELHPLRAGDGGDAPQRVREDGAKAYRAALQVHSPSARRLHYWLLPDGQVEFAKVVYHDDVSIR